MYQQQMGNRFRLAERNSNGKAVWGWGHEVENRKKNSGHDDMKTAENYGVHFG